MGDHDKMSWFNFLPYLSSKAKPVEKGPETLLRWCQVSGRFNLRH